MAWLPQALAGCARREVLSRRPEGEATTAAEVLAILKETFGDQRDLLTTFHSRRQGICERVVEYAQSLVMLSIKVNEAGTVNDEMLRDRFVDGLQPLSLRRDI